MCKIKKLRSNNNSTYIFCYESLWQSILSDIFTLSVVSLWLSALYFNFQYLGDSILLKIFIIGMLLIYFFSRSKGMTREYKNKKDFLDDIEKDMLEIENNKKGI